MLWWFLILGVSAAVVVSVAITLFLQVRCQMKRSVSHKEELAALDQIKPSWPPEA
jgi:preprotein translocase subunit YajC